MTFEFPGQRMKFRSWSVHIFRPLGVIKRKHLQAQLTGVLRLYPCFRPGVEELLDSPVSKAFDHVV